MTVLIILLVFVLAILLLKRYVDRRYPEVKKEYRLAGFLVNALTSFSTQEEALRKNPPARYMGKKPGRSRNCRITERRFSGTDGKEHRVIVYTPLDSNGPGEARTGLFWIHGGGYLGGSPVTEKLMASLFVRECGAVVVSPEYTLSSIAPYPAAFDDSWECLLWMYRHAEELGFDPKQLFIGGGSAGGGLVTALCLKARDNSEVSLAFQIPIYPMINDKMDTPSAQDNHAFLWNSETNEVAWRLYLGDLFETDRVPKYAAAARETDYSGLPPAYTYVGTLDPFYDDTLAYVERLQAAGVPAKVDVYECAYHGFDALNIWTKSVKECHRKLIEEFKNAQRTCDS